MEFEEQEGQVDVKKVIINSDDQLEFLEQREMRQASRHAGSSEGTKKSKTLQYVSIPNLELEDPNAKDINDLKHEEIQLPKPQPAQVQLSNAFKQKEQRDRMKIGVQKALFEVYESLSPMIQPDPERKKKPLLVKKEEDEESAIKQMLVQEANQKK